MAAIAIQPSPGSLSAMANTTRRFPLSSKPNAANSPFRHIVPALTGKRSRSHINNDLDQPPLKRQVLDTTNDENLAPRTLTRQSLALQEAETTFFLRKPQNGHLTALDKKLLAVARDNKDTCKQSQTHPQQAQTKSPPTLEEIKQWQRHYKRLFPSFVFYFDSVSEDVRLKTMRLAQALGAKEEKFFSKAVTHVITTRSIPAEHAASPDAAARGSHKTIDPSLLGTTQDPERNTHALSRAVHLLQSTLKTRNAQHSTARGDPKKLVTSTSTDILCKARDLNIKIWALEKLQRIIATMLNHADAEDPKSLTRSNATAKLDDRQSKEADLQRLLRNEKVLGPADRDLSAAATGQDMCQLRGYYIFIRDLNEKTRPVMVRDYAKVEQKELGKWPQFRCSVAGRCPFIASSPHDLDRENGAQRIRATGRQPQIHAAVPRTRSRAAEICKPGQDTIIEQKVLAQASTNLRRSPRKQTQTDVDMVKPSLTVNTSLNGADSMPPLFGSAQVNKRGLPRFIAGEPVASGVQPSNVTSAIRSQAISSTAVTSAMPGMRNGTSKELHALQRKVLERGTTVVSGQPLASSCLNDVRAALNGDVTGHAWRGTKRKAHETLGYIHEDADAEQQARPTKVRQTRTAQKAAPKELKPGYCENCGDKFDDFDEHIGSKKHRKFATTAEHFKELDMLLEHLQR